MARRRKASCSYKRGNTGFNTNRKFRSSQTRHSKTTKFEKCLVNGFVDLIFGGLF